MSTPFSALKPLAAAALVAAAGASHAAITVVNSLTAFNASTTAQGTDTFTDLPIFLDVIDSPLTRTTTTGVSYSYRTSTPGGFYGAGSLANPAQAPSEAADAMTFDNFVSPVLAVGGNFFGANVTGDFKAGLLTVSATDASGTVTQTLFSGSTSAFLGFVSTTGITQLVVAATVQPPGGLWPAVDNLVFASPAVAAVPEPGSWLMLVGGLVAVGGLARRRSA